MDETLQAYFYIVQIFPWTKKSCRFKIIYILKYFSPFFQTKQLKKGFAHKLRNAFKGEGLRYAPQGVGKIIAKVERGSKSGLSVKKFVHDPW